MASLVSGAQNQIQAQNGRFLLWYTTGIVSSWQSASQCYTALSSGGMNDKNYFTAGPPPSIVNNAIGTAGFQAFINLKTATLMGKDSMSNTQIINWATQANQ